MKDDQLDLFKSTNKNKQTSKKVSRKSFSGCFGGCLRVCFYISTSIFGIFIVGMSLEQIDSMNLFGANACPEGYAYAGRNRCRNVVAFKAIKAPCDADNRMFRFGTIWSSGKLICPRLKTVLGFPANRTIIDSDIANDIISRDRSFRDYGWICPSQQKNCRLDFGDLTTRPFRKYQGIFNKSQIGCPKIEFQPFSLNTCKNLIIKEVRLYEGDPIYIDGRLKEGYTSNNLR